MKCPEIQHEILALDSRAPFGMIRYSLCQYNSEGVYGRDEQQERPRDRFACGIQGMHHHAQGPQLAKRSEEAEKPSEAKKPQELRRATIVEDIILAA